MNGPNKLICTLMVLVTMLTLSGCDPAQKGKGDASRSDEGVYTSLSQIEDKRIGVTTGSIQAVQAEERFPNATFFYFSTSPDMLNALKSNKVDAIADSDILIEYMMAEEPALTYIKEPLASGMNASAIFAKTDKGQQLRDEYNVFLKEAKASGEYDEVTQIWTGSDESKKVVPDLGGLPATNGTLHMAADLTMTPFEFVKNNEPAGIDIDMAYRFGKARGYAIKLENMDFGAIIPSITSGKSDFAAGGVVYTEERAESVLFSDPTYEGGSVIGVLKKDASAGAGFLSSLKESFEKTFLRESRWKLFVEGIGNTLLITVLSIALGTLLGFAAYLACRGGNVVANRIAGAFVWLINGMPVVVLLMVLFYIVFGNTDLSGLAVSIVAFSLIFGAAMFGMLRSGVNAVDKGQTEAAYALGYTDRKAFFCMILPQAAIHFMPTYRGQVVSLLKATAVVGYIAVQDLTKMGDIVRSRTYEAFFPLIAITVIYFVLAAVLIWIIARVTRHINPRNRSPKKVLEGVQTHD